MKFQQQLGKEFEKSGKTRAVEEEIYIQEEWNQIKEVTVEAAEQTIGYQPKPDRRGWFDDECRIALDEKNAEYKKWIDRPARSKKLEYERLWKVAHKKCKKKNRTYIDNPIRNTEWNVKDKHIKNAYKEVGSVKAGFKHRTDFCRGANNEILSNEEDTNTRWKTYFQDLLTTAAEHDTSSDNTLTNQTATKEELEEDPPSIRDIEMAIQSMNNNITWHR